MDTSEIYILMCEKAKEIQKLKHYKDGDIFVNFVAGKWQKPNIYTRGRVIPYESGDYDVWLPRQDQLQGLVEEMPMDYLERLLDIWIVMGCPEDNITWEQFWLSIVMKDKYNKKWDGNDWVSPFSQLI